MPSEKQFQQNVELWAHADPKHAVRLQYLDSSDLIFCKTNKDELNLKGREGYYHAQSGAKDEARKWFSTLQLEGVPVIYVYGVGLGYYYEAAKEWLQEKPEHRLIFLEDNLAVLRRFLETEQAEEMLRDVQVQLLYFQDLKDNEAVFEVLYWNFAMKRLIVTALQLYAKKRKELFEKLRHQIAYDAAVKNALVDEYVRLGGPFFINFYQNMLALPGAYLGNKTFGSFRKVPAIICGAGPSLEKQLPLLAKLLDKALVFAGGSAMNVLNAFNIQPHLGAGIDPNPAQFERLSNNTAFEVPYYYRNRLYNEAFKTIHGPRLYVTGCGGYDVGDFFEEKLKIAHEFLDEGHNVINFCLQIAYQLGCDPIIFVGMDLAFTNMKTYSPGVEKEVGFDPESLLDIDDFDSRPMLLKDIYGKPLYTLWKWVAEADWIGDFAKEHPDVSIYNCTEGGLGFAHVANEPLQEIVKRHLKRTYPLYDRLQGEIENATMPKVTKKKMVGLFNELHDSLKRCEEDLVILLEDAAIQKEKKVFNQGGRAALAETELAEEPGFGYVLDIFNQVQARLLNRELHESRGEDESERSLKKVDINIRRLTFLRQVASVNAGLIEMVLQNQEKLSRVKKIAIKPLKPLAFSKNLGIILPEKPVEGQQLKSEHVVRVLRQYGKPKEAAWVEKGGVQDGQYCLYYSDGKLKAECYYQKGVLHGPSRFYSPKGFLVAESLYQKGKREGECRWYYASGKLYALQRFQKGLWHGKQEYFYESGQPKTVLHYNRGKLAGQAQLYLPNGNVKRTIQF